VSSAVLARPPPTVPCPVLQATAAEVRALAPDAGLRLETLGKRASERTHALALTALSLHPSRAWRSHCFAKPTLLTLPCRPCCRLSCHCHAGGGRIEHYPAQRAAAVYGYSAAFGQAPHHVTAALMRRWLPFHEITASYDGY